MEIEEVASEDLPKSELLARELEYYLKCYKPNPYLRDLLKRSADTIHTIQVGVN